MASKQHAAEVAQLAASHAAVVEQHKAERLCDAEAAEGLLADVRAAARADQDRLSAQVQQAEAAAATVDASAADQHEALQSLVRDHSAEIEQAREASTAAAAAAEEEHSAALQRLELLRREEAPAQCREHALQVLELQRRLASTEGAADAASAALAAAQEQQAASSQSLQQQSREHAQQVQRLQQQLDSSQAAAQATARTSEQAGVMQESLTALRAALAEEVANGRSGLAAAEARVGQLEAQLASAGAEGTAARLAQEEAVAGECRPVWRSPWRRNNQICIMLPWRPVRSNERSVVGGGDGRCRRPQLQHRRSARRGLPSRRQHGWKASVRRRRKTLPWLWRMLSASCKPPRRK